jgi:hypothetical protein
LQKFWALDRTNNVRSLLGGLSLQALTFAAITPPPGEASGTEKQAIKIAMTS